MNPLYLFSDKQRRAQIIRRNKKVKKMGKKKDKKNLTKKRKCEIVISIGIIIIQALPLEESPTYRENRLFYFK